MRGPADRWVREFRPAGPDAVTLCCFPHAGGSASYYLPLAAALAPDVRVLAVQYPGRQDRHGEPPVATIAELADRITTALLPHTERPFAFFGHSMGAILAFEVTRRLTDRRPAVLFVSGRRAPSCVRDEAVHLLPDDGLLAETRRLDGTAAQLLVDDDLVQLFLPALRADYRAIETYRCVPPDAAVGCPIVALTGVDDPKTSPAEAAAWRRHTTADFRLHRFAGGHFFLADRWSEVATILSGPLSTPAAMRDR